MPKLRSIVEIYCRLKMYRLGGKTSTHKFTDVMTAQDLVKDGMDNLN